MGGWVKGKALLRNGDVGLFRQPGRAIWPGVPPDGRVTERAVEPTQDFMLKVSAVKEKAPYAALVSDDIPPN